MSLSVRSFCAVVAITCAALFSLSGCGSNEKEVTFKSGGITQTFTDGTSTKTQDFPLPIYPNAKPTGEVQASNDGDENSKFLMLASNDKVEDITNFYDSKLKSDGWTVNTKLKEPQLVNLSATKNDLDASVMVSADADGKATISIAISKQSNDAPKATGKVFTPDNLNPPTD